MHLHIPLCSSFEASSQNALVLSPLSSFHFTFQLLPIAGLLSRRDLISPLYAFVQFDTVEAARAATEVHLYLFGLVIQVWCPTTMQVCLCMFVCRAFFSLVTGWFFGVVSESRLFHG